MSTFDIVEPPQSQKSSKSENLTKRQLFFIALIVTSAIVLISVFFAVLYTGGHEVAQDQLVKLISPVVKKSFEGFKVKFHKNYTTVEEE